MSKTLITVDNLQDFISGGRLQMDGSKILTAGARDELTRRGIEVAWSDATAACCGSGGQHAETPAPCHTPEKEGPAYRFADFRSAVYTKLRPHLYSSHIELALNS